MPETRKYVMQNMSAVELIGYNKVADNTFVNIVPMTTGKFIIKRLHAWGILTIKSSISMLRIFLPYEIIFIERNMFHVFYPRKFFDEFSGQFTQMCFPLFQQRQM
jgi:hypothetical protein